MEVQFNLDYYNYELPDILIAKEPIYQRDKSKLLVYNKGEISDQSFSEIANHIPNNALLVLNDTKVIPARLVFKKSTGASIEIFLLQKISNIKENQKAERWNVLIGNKKKFGKNDFLSMEIPNTDDHVSVTWIDSDKDIVEFKWEGNQTFKEIIEEIGRIPLPPYLKREASESDKVNYQTVYAQNSGAVAAPTAGLHFTKDVFDTLNIKKIKQCNLTLHVGLGTFKPIKDKDVRLHQIHKEKFSITKEAIVKLKSNNFIVAVGTTSLRVLESLPIIAYKIKNNLEFPEEVFQSDSKYFADLPEKKETIEIILNYLEEKNQNNLDTYTSIFILPGFNFNIVNSLITNFHQPSSTLLLLISAFIGPKWKNLYSHAINKRYRFLSYGDASLLIP